MAEEAKNKASAPKFRTSIGGQALIEGVLMRGPGKQANVVRSPDGLVEKVAELTLVRDKFGLTHHPRRGDVRRFDGQGRQGADVFGGLFPR